MPFEKMIISGCELSDYLRTCVQGAISHQKVSATSEAEFYLVHLLEEFEKAEKLFEYHEGRVQETPLAILFARSFAEDESQRVVVLKHLGDLSVYMAGFFSDNIDQNKFVDLDYYITMGGGAYHKLSLILREHKTFGELYNELSIEFARFVAVLSEVSDKAHLHTNTDILRLYERWLKTGDERIKELLLEKGISFNH
jgi:hypothetical protein